DMPQMDGIELCHRIKSQPELRDIPVIFISALDSTSDKVRAFEAGGSDYITKPFQADEVFVRVKNQIAAYRYQEHARTLAAYEERQRIARDLHDSVNQILFSTGIVAQTLLLELDQMPPQAVRAQVHRINDLTQDALMEMRALLLELTPERIKDVPLYQLIVQLARRLAQRADIAVNTFVDEVDPPLTVKQALYRITQEALGNAIKHAGPAEINLSLKRWRRGVQLMVQDDGVGFVPGEFAADQFGLRNMTSRAAEIGATFTIDSAPDEGTLVLVQWEGPA
ncbi:MAG: response regulator, partial [Chloroflexi bacterium]|nr:response regulator [Chloroflexota bacterium]